MRKSTSPVCSGDCAQLRQGFRKGCARVLFFPVQRKFGRNFTVFVSGGAPLDPEVFRFWNSMGFTVLEGYGLTEISPVLCVNTMERQVAGSVGPPLPGVQLKIEGKEVLARGDNVFPGYYENEQASRDAFTDDGWFRTGDLGEIGPDGWLVIKGREKELIVTGSGINVYPDELEAVLNKIAGVKESCVIGVERGGGEEVHAVLLLDGSGTAPEEIIGQANSSLDTLHQITGFTLWNEPEFPKTTTLKIKKFVVKEEVKKGPQGGDATVSRDSLLNLLARVTGTGCRADPRGIAAGGRPGPYLHRPAGTGQFPGTGIPPRYRGLPDRAADAGLGPAPDHRETGKADPARPFPLLDQ